MGLIGASRCSNVTARCVERQIIENGLDVGATSALTPQDRPRQS
jgi:hypothetical protein